MFDVKLVVIQFVIIYYSAILCVLGCSRVHILNLDLTKLIFEFKIRKFRKTNLEESIFR